MTLPRDRTVNFSLLVQAEPIYSSSIRTFVYRWISEVPKDRQQNLDFKVFSGHFRMIKLFATFWIPHVIFFKSTYFIHWMMPKSGLFIQLRLPAVISSNLKLLNGDRKRDHERKVEWDTIIEKLKTQFLTQHRGESNLLACPFTDHLYGNIQNTRNSSFRY